MKISELYVGAQVIVTNSGQGYSTYDEMAELLGATKWKRFEYIQNGSIFNVLAWKKHMVGKDIVVLVGNENVQYLIGAQGIELTEDPLPNIQIPSLQEILGI